MAVKVYPFDPADHLETEEDVDEYLRLAAEGGDKAHLASAQDDVRRARERWEKARLR